MSDDFLTTSALAQRLNVSCGTVHRWRASGKIPEPVELTKNFFVWPVESVRHLFDDAGLPGSASTAPAAC